MANTAIRSWIKMVQSQLELSLARLSPSVFFGSVMLYRNWFEHETYLRMYSLKWNISSPLKCPLLEKLCMNLGGIRFKDIILFNLSIFFNLIPLCFFAYTSAS